MKNGKKIKIGDFIDQVRGVTYSSDDVIEKSREGYLPVLRANGIYDGELNFDDLVYVPKKKISDIQLIKKGDIVMAASSGSKEVVGKTAFVFEDWKGGFGAFCKVIRTKPSLNPLYLSFYFRSKIYRGIISSIVTGANINNIRNDDLNNLEIPLPDLKTQQEIAQVLEQADKARQQRKAANALTDQFLQSSFLSLFGDPVKNEKGWEVKILDDVCDKITDGTHHSPINLEAGDYKYITAKNIKEEGILMSNISYVTAEAHKAIYSRCNPEFEDVLYIKDGVTTGIAVVNHLKEEFSMLSSVALLKCNRKILSPYFLAAYLNNDSVYDGIRKNMGGAAITRVTLQKINAIKMILPPLSLQQQFAGIVAQAEALRKKQKENETELENLFQSLLQKYFG